MEVEKSSSVLSLSLARYLVDDFLARLPSAISGSTYSSSGEVSLELSLAEEAI